jgi:tetratricopeptide (TPR) repeat protein
MCFRHAGCEVSGPKQQLEELYNGQPSDSAVRASIPLTTRLAIEIPKPKDWQAFQRACVILFRAELNDPHAQEYGRPGQHQGGIDILARRNGQSEHFVGIQCRLIVLPVKETAILADARSALRLVAGLKELIFATTAKDDTKATDAAIRVTRKLKEEGHELTVVVYGWGQLQTLIAPHDVAYNVFHPSAVAKLGPQNLSHATNDAEIANLIATQVVAQMRGAGLTAAPREGSTSDSSEDPGLHARIDTYRDLAKQHGQPQIAEKSLLALLEKEDLANKPWARYRIETNLGVIAIDLGREFDAAGCFERAYSIRPNDPNALANLAVAQTVRGRFEEAMATASAALEGKPRPDHAIAYLLQAAARSDWIGEPETLIPTDLVGTAHADIGLADFLRRRDLSGWAGHSLDLAQRHPDMLEFKRIRATAVLALAIESSAILAGSHGPFSNAELNLAADDMKAFAEHCLEVNFADVRDLFAYINNAVVLLRLCDRHQEGEALLVRAMTRVGGEPQARRLLALARTSLGREKEALETLIGDTDPENQILRAELQAATGDVRGALMAALNLDPGGLADRLQYLRWRTIGEASARLNDTTNLSAAIAGLRELCSGDVTAALLEIRGKRRTPADNDDFYEQLRNLAKSVAPDLDMVARYELASTLWDNNLPEEASRLLEGHIEFGRPSSASSLYLQCLAAARRDKAFQDALTKLDAKVRNAPDTLWTVAQHAWNLGDLEASEKAIDGLLTQRPDEPRARLFKLEILVRRDRSTELLEELERPLEKLNWRQSSDQFRLALLLWNFGFAERAVGLAYTLFLQHRDLPRAWMTLSMLLFEEGRRNQYARQLQEMKLVGPNAAVDIVYDDGSTVFFVVEPDEGIRKLDQESWEPDHPLVRTVDGLGVGVGFVRSDGRKGEIRQVRHKYVARLHYVMEHYETRFPEISGFQRIAIDFEQPGGLEPFIARMKERHDWVAEEEGRYVNEIMPLAVLAHRLGMDTIDMSASLANHGVNIKVATGSHEEREAATGVVRRNRRRGCVLDLLTFWTAYRLQALEAVSATCGPIHIAQSVLDRLRRRRDRYDLSASDGAKSAGYQDGQIVLQETPAEIIILLRDEVHRAITWAEANTEVSPVVAGDDLPTELREHLRLGRSDILDGIVLAREQRNLLVTDDLPIRELNRVLEGGASAWLQVVFSVALDWKHIELDQYVRWTAALVDAGRNYLSVTGPVLAHAARLDARGGEAPGHLFRTLGQLVGGHIAEPVSHINATLMCLSELWEDHRAAAYREPVTSHLLNQLVSYRYEDYADILRILFVETRNSPALSTYIQSWINGHFFAKAVFATSRTPV